jgi:hypothetical protein
MRFLQAKKLMLVGVLLVAVSVASAQLHERIYIQSDRNSFVAGETVWFKVYLLNSLMPGSTSTNLLLDLVDESGKRISSGSLPIFGATASGSLDLPLTLVQGIYFLRVYTNTKPDKNNYFSATRILHVFNPSATTPPVAGERVCIFHPSSGNLVVGIANTVYVETCDPLGKPAITEGKILNAKGEELAVFATDANGRARFALLPGAGEEYTAHVKYADGTIQKIALPRPDETKVLLSVWEAPKARQFNVFIPENLRDGAVMSIKGYMDENLVFEKKFTANTAQINARIPVDELPTGLLQLMVVNAKQQKLAEAASFIMADSAFVPVTFNADTLSLTPNGKNVFTITLPEGIAGSFSVSITDKEKTIYTEENNIVTGLLLNQDSKEHTFISSADLTAALPKEQLDLLIGTTVWRDQSVAAADTMIRYDSGYITIRGKVLNKGNKKPLAKGDLSFTYTTRDSVTNMLAASIEKDGSFILPQLIFEGNQLFRYSLNGDKWIELALNMDTSKPEDRFPLPFRQNRLTLDRSLFADEAKLALVKEMHTILLSDSISSTGLREVTVTARKVPPKQQVNDRYTSGLFRSMASAKTLDLINDPPSPAYNILDHLQGQVPGLLISSNGGNYTVQSNRQLSLTLMPEVRLFLNEMPTTIDFLKGIRATDVALVKYYPPGMGGAIPTVGIGAALVVYTKKPTDGGTEIIGAMSQFKYPGYLLTKDFTNDYLQKNTLGIGRRNTVYWNANLFPEEGAAVYKIRFTNSETAKKLKLVMEGVASDGRLLHFEKILE